MNTKCGISNQYQKDKLLEVLGQLLIQLQKSSSFPALSSGGPWWTERPVRDSCEIIVDPHQSALCEHLLLKQVRLIQDWGLCHL